jgi:hypothetical protein
MQHYTIPPQGIDAMRKEVLKRTLPVIVVGGSLPFIIELIQSGDNSFNMPFFLIVIPLLVVVVRFTVSRLLQKQVKLMERYSLVIGNQTISWQQGNSHGICIRLADITVINKNRNGSFTVKGRHPKDVIHIPAHISEYDKLEQSLSACILHS